MPDKPSYEELEQQVRQLKQKLAERDKKLDRLQLLSAITENMSESVVATNADFEITYLNKKAEDLFGYTIDEVIGQRPDIFNAEPVADKIQAELYNKVASGGIYFSEHLNKRKNGTKFLCEFKVFPLTADKGETYAYVGIQRDVTVQREAEKKIQQERAFLEKLLETSPVGITVVDPEGQIIQANAYAEKIHGLTRSDIYNRSYDDPDWHITDFDGNAWPDEKLPFQIVKRTGQSVFGIEHAIQWPDGKRVLLSINASPLFDNNGSFNGMVAAIENVTERRQAEASLREREEKYRFLAENMADVVWIMDLNFQLTYVSPSVKKMLGYSPEERMNQPLEEQATPASLKQIMTRFEEELARDTKPGSDPYRTITIEVEYYHKDGSTVWVENYIRPIRNSDGELVGMHGVSRDITDRKQVEEELKQIEWMLSKTSASNSEAQAENHDQGYGDLTKLNRDGLILKSIGYDRLKSFANDYLELLGTSSAIYEVKGDYALGLFSSGWCRMMDNASRKRCDTPDNIEALNSGRWLCHESCWTDCSQKAITKRAPVDIKCNGGMRIYAVPISAGGEVIGAINFGYGDPPQDPEKLKMLADLYHCNYGDLLREAKAYNSRPAYIIELAKKRLERTATLIGSMVEAKQAMEKLNESEEWLAETAQIARVGGWKIDPLGNTIEWTDETFRIHELPIGDPLHMTEAIQFYHPEDRPRVSAAVQQAIDNGEDFDFEARIFTAMQNLIWIRAIGHPRFHEGRMVLLWGTIQDITELKKTEESLRQVQKMESIGTLAGGIAHEFNNMLAIMIGNAELAIDGIPEQNPAAGFIQQIQNAGLRAKDVVRKLLSVARKMPAARKPLQISTVINESLSLLRKTIPTTIDLKIALRCTTELILGDSTELSQILINLCTNAVHAMNDQTGVLEVNLASMQLDHQSAIRYPDLKPGDYARLTVKDNGKGIEPELIDRIFDPYFTTKDVGQGLGMGLAVVYGIVKNHDGAISIKSEVGKGTTVEVLFPLIEEQKAVSTEKTETETPPTGMERILFVDDEPALVEMATQMLERSGYEVVGKTNSIEALKAFKENPDQFDLMITDMAMPDMAGDRLAQEINRVRPNIPIILCTGHSDIIDENRAVALGITSFLMKPVMKSQITKEVRKLLDEAKSKNFD